VDPDTKLVNDPQKEKEKKGKGEKLWTSFMVEV
jgi:hypothetical protein